MRSLALCLSVVIAGATSEALANDPSVLCLSLALSGDQGSMLAACRTAASQGSVHAQARLGLMYLNGEGVVQDFQTALSLLDRAAQSDGLWGGISKAALGDIYRLGLGTQQDMVQAFTHYRDAVQQGYDKAQYNLGVMYRFGQGTDRNLGEAVALFRNAALQGDAYAQIALAEMYSEGEGVIQDYVTAHMWSNIAAANGLGAAQDLRDHLSRYLGTEEVNQAQRRARACLDSNYLTC